ncbi:MAG: hypothetical protein QOD50_1126, partial [Actinomycetota bacterium]|nr:hypothetical protein [Actinomycetota bacterium]
MSDGTPDRSSSQLEELAARL